MFQFAKNNGAESICYVTHGTMGHLDAKQPPSKRKPYGSILAVPFVQKAELILPAELYEIVKDQLSTSHYNPKFSRVILPLSSILEGEFFNAYIKTGDILMLSEGQYGVDNVYSLRDGILSLSLDKESYERTGLVGTPSGNKGSRGGRSRWVVEINLRLPSMLHGRKGFDRIVYAFKNVLVKPVTWTFVNLGTAILPVDPLAKHFPTIVECPWQASQYLNVALPQLQPPVVSSSGVNDDFSDYVGELYEWLSLVSLESPRVLIGDDIDSFLSQYVPPVGDDGDLASINVVRLTWEGFMAAKWAHEVFIAVLLTTPSEMWLSFVVSAFSSTGPEDCKDCTILKCPGSTGEYILWEVDQR